VDSIKSRTIQHFCPACRTPYSILTIDPALIPPYLRPHILPPIRKVFFDDPTPAAASSSTSGPAQTAFSGDLGRAVAEVNALQTECATWRRRAEVHAAGNTNLLRFARAAKDCALRLRNERDAERNRYLLLKRKLAEMMPELDLESESPFTERKQHEGRRAAVPREGLPVFLMQCKPPEHFYDNPADMTHSHFGPPMKRRKESPKRDSETAPIPPGSVPDAAAAPVFEAGPRVLAATPLSDSAISSRRLKTLGAR